MSRRAPVKLGEMVEGDRSEAAGKDDWPEPTKVIYVRAPISVSYDLDDIARKRTRKEGRRVTKNELMLEAMTRFIKDSV